VVNRSPVVDLSPLTLEHRRQALLQLYWKACADYFPQPYPGRISVLYSADEAREDRPKYDWKRVAKDVEIRQVPGRHLTMLTQHIQGLAREVKECLKPATRASPESATVEVFPGVSGAGRQAQIDAVDGHRRHVVLLAEILPGIAVTS